MPRKKILLTTNPPWFFSGLAENGKFLAQWLQKTGKYDLCYYASQVSVLDPNHGRQPWKSRGCIPADQNVIQRANADPNFARALSYGNLLIGDVVREEKPDIVWCSDDLWSYTSSFYQSPWWSQINSIFHITVDSVPVLEQAYDQAKSTPNFYTWAKFAATEMQKRGKEFAHVKQIYGATNTQNFAPLSDGERLELRKRFGIDPKTTVFGYCGRNQLRKEFSVVLAAFAQFKSKNPKANVKLHFHTSFSETASGWDFPRLIKHLGIDPKDILSTYVCKNCQGWHVAPYIGEDQNCPHCGAQKSMVTATIAHGVPGEEMKYVYGVRDATVSAFTSGGLEYENVNTLLCGLPLASTNYSCGEDFCEQPFVYPIKWHFRSEAGTSFTKATNDVDSIEAFMQRILSLKPQEREAIKEQSRDWAVRTFSIEAIGPQWEAAFDALPPKDWSSIKLDYVRKPDNAPMPPHADPQAFVKALYNDILLVEPDPDGFKHWLAQLERGIPRDHMYRYFLGEAAKDNAKNAPPQDFGTLFDGKTEDPARRKRLLFVMKESGGDLFIATALFPSLKALYPDADIYVGCDPKFADILALNPHVHRVLAYHPAMDAELAMRNYVDYYYWPALATQVRLNYLTRERVGFDLNAEPFVAQPSLT